DPAACIPLWRNAPRRASAATPTAVPGPARLQGPMEQMRMGSPWAREVYNFARHRCCYIGSLVNREGLLQVTRHDLLHWWLAHSLLIPPPAATTLELKSLQQQAQLRQAHLRHRNFVLRPLERGLLQSLTGQPEAAAVKEQTADSIAAAIAEGEDRARQGILPQYLTHQPSQSIQTQPTIGRSRLQKHPSLLTQPEHVSRPRSSSVIHLVSEPAEILSSIRFGNRISTISSLASPVRSSNETPFIASAGISTTAPLPTLPRDFLTQYDSVETGIPRSWQNRFALTPLCSKSLSRRFLSCAG